MLRVTIRPIVIVIPIRDGKGIGELNGMEKIGESEGRVRRIWTAQPPVSA